MHEFLIVVHLLVAAAIIGLVLLQQGKGADMGAAFGSGASQTLFGSRGSATFLSRSTAVLATIFFLTSLALTVMSGKPSGATSVTEQVPVVQQQAPAAPQPADGAPAVPK